MERKKSLSSSSAQKTRTSLVVCCRGERERHAHQRRVFEEVVRCVAHPRFGFAFWSRDLLVVANAAKNTGNVTTTVGLSRCCCVCVLRIEMIAKISPPPFFCVCGSRHDDAVSKRGESSLFEDETERQLFDHHHHHRHHETTKGGFSRASFSFVVVVVVVVVVRDYTRRRRSFSTLMMRRKKWFWFFVSQSLFATKKIERKKALKKENQ